MRLPNRNYIDRTLKKSYEGHETEITFFPYIPRLPNLYGEVIGKSYGTPITVKGYLEMDPTELKLQELGWSKEGTEFILHVPFITLLENGLANEDGTLVITTDYKIGIPNLNKEYQVGEFQLREPFLDGRATLVSVSGVKFINGR